jgi:RNA polymerase sigma-70 factor (ECF subfamily)
MSADRSNSFDLNALFKAAHAGDRSAENKLMQHLTVSFRLFAQHRLWNEPDAEEVVQDALLTIVTKYHEVEIESSFAGWAYRVLQNKIMDYVKKRSARRRLDEQWDRDHQEHAAVTPDPELRSRLINCFRKLARQNSRHARILNLHYQGFATADICHKLGITETNLYVLLSRARRALELCLGKDERA